MGEEASSPRRVGRVKSQDARADKNKNLDMNTREPLLNTIEPDDLDRVQPPPPPPPLAATQADAENGAPFLIARCHD